VLLPALPPRIRARSASDPAAGVPSREEVLGTKGHVSVVLCSFNQFYKLNPDIWRLWMHVLRRTGPDSVLWMLEFDGDAVNNLVEEAIMMGVGTHRIVVSSLLPLSREFLSKGTCDLYLDTPLFNAHTTAKDALWSGVPVLTLAGEGMAARVAASLVLLLDPAAVTVARNLHDYQELAVRIAGNASALASLKRRVRQLRWTSPVFDTVGWMGRWERQLRNAADLVAAGYFPPAHMHLAGGSTRDVR
jgi:protein O-GlcNAc transferase